MSHAATNWAVKQRGIPAAAKIVLWHLADRHNPDRGCFPSQARLAEDCELSRRSLNDQLQRLEDAGLIRREKRIDPTTRRQQNTRYILGFEPDFDQDADCPAAGRADNTRGDNRLSQGRVQNLHTEGDGRSDCENSAPEGGEPSENICPSRVQNLHTEAVCKSTSEPCANSCKSRVQNLHTNPVRGTSKRTMCSAGGETHTDFDFDDVLDRFQRAYPRLGDPEATHRALRAAIEAGADPERIVRAAWAYAEEQRGNRRQYIAYSENWLDRNGWEKLAPSSIEKQAGAQEVDAHLAETIKSGKRFLCTHISAAKAQALVDRGLVTVEECKKVAVL